MKNRMLVMIMALALALPVYSLQEEGVMPAQENAVEQVQTDENIVQKDEVVDNVPEEKILTKESFKQPTSKRRVAKKFIIAMLSVGISSFIIFAVLSLYNKFRDSFSQTPMLDKKEEPSSLETPDNLNDAVKSFLDRTHWEN